VKENERKKGRKKKRKTRKDDIFSFVSMCG
jgi:hypothetical protein